MEFGFIVEIWTSTHNHAQPDLLSTVFLFDRLVKDNV
jgi:hypothetical protein